MTLLHPLQNPRKQCMSTLKYSTHSGWLLYISCHNMMVLIQRISLVSSVQNNCTLASTPSSSLSPCRSLSWQACTGHTMCTGKLYVFKLFDYVPHRKLLLMIQRITLSLGPWSGDIGINGLMDCGYEHRVIQKSRK